MPIVEYLNYEMIDAQGWDLSDDENFERAVGMDLPALLNPQKATG